MRTKELFKWGGQAMKNLRVVTSLSYGSSADWASRSVVVLVVAMAVAVEGGCGSSGPGGPALDPDLVPVTITYLRHDNPNYLKADNAFFAEYMQKHKNVTIVDTTVDF